MAIDEKIDIMVVDDTPENLLVFTAILEDMGVNVVTASSGGDALKQVLEHDFAVILLDVNMPGMDGLEAAQLIHGRKRSAHTPIIFITAYADEVYAARGYAKGAVDFILSPVVPEVLRTKVRVFVELVRMHRKMVRQADERAALAEERTKRLAAEAASEAKSRFVATVSHDLRTPMNAIQGLVDLALEVSVDPTAKELLQTARQSTELLLALLDDLLDGAKLESGKLELASAPFEVRNVVEQTARVFAARVSQKGITLSHHVDSEVPIALLGDQVRLRQILFNLVGNAVKFTERGYIELSVRVRSLDAVSCCLELAVRDTGIGIPPSDLERIFQPYDQGDAFTARRFGGTGLGLAICSRLVSLMGGRIWVESRVGEGSTFFFTVQLPLAKLAPSVPDSSRTFLERRASALRILLAEDNPANQKLVRYALSKRGHTVEVAANGRLAVSMALARRYDAILMDVQMPGMDGLEATGAIRAQEAWARVPIIAMTANAMRGDRERCLDAGMDAYLSKPIATREMVALVEQLAGAAGSDGVSHPAASAGTNGSEP